MPLLVMHHLRMATLILLQVNIIIETLVLKVLSGDYPIKEYVYYY